MPDYNPKRLLHLGGNPELLPGLFILLHLLVDRKCPQCGIMTHAVGGLQMVGCAGLPCEPELPNENKELRRVSRNGIRRAL
jgi:hypothetical protein